MTDYEYNAQIEKEREEYHKKRSEESYAYKAVYDGFKNLELAIQEQNKKLCAAICGQEYVQKENTERSEPQGQYTFEEYLEAIKEYGEDEALFDAKLIKKSGFEW